MTLSLNRSLSKLAAAREFEGGSERRPAAYKEVREELSTEPTRKLPAAVEFGNRSMEFNQEFSNHTSVEFHLWPIQSWLSDPDITEICINQPFEVFVNKNGHWEQHKVDTLNYHHLESLSIAVARHTNKTISDTAPLLSANLPQNERIQIVYPPACESGKISITIRKPSKKRFTLEEYQKQGFFARIRPLNEELTEEERHLLSLKDQKNYLEFFKKAVEYKKVIILAGSTDSGKTTFMKTLVQSISTDQRIITIEDIPELTLPNHPNHVHLFYPSEAQTKKDSLLTSSDLLRSSLRMRPDRIILPELRGVEAFGFINAAISGHDGSITSYHAGSAQLAFERLVLMILQSEEGRSLSYEIIKRLLYQVVDVVAHMYDFEEDGRALTEIWYNPWKKRECLEADSIKVLS